MKHLKAPYGNVMCRCDYSGNVPCWERGSNPIKEETCPECWEKAEKLKNAFRLPDKD